MTPASPIVGVLSVLEYTTPRSLMLAPPSELALPPSVADVVEIDEAAVVEIVGVVIPYPIISKL